MSLTDAAGNDINDLHVKREIYGQFCNTKSFRDGRSGGQTLAAADALRNNMDAAEYKHVVLGLIFLKYISDAFEAKLTE